jgi:tryptophan 2,3-dioxygenase
MNDTPETDAMLDIERERDRYKTALEGIAGFPQQYFDSQTPWRMRELAEHALTRADD